MPKASKATAAETVEVEGYEGHLQDLDGGYTVAFETYTADADLTPYFTGLPDEQCQAAHWGYVVRGKGSEASLSSAAHGAGRRMSRRRAKETFTWDQAQRFLKERGVVLLSAGLDEVPMAYKDIEKVMAAQEDLVERLARFDPRLVKMAPSGEPPED